MKKKTKDQVSTIVLKRMPKEGEALPKQARVLLEVLGAAKGGKLTLAELAKNAQGKLKTVQTVPGHLQSLSEGADEARLRAGDGASEDVYPLFKAYEYELNGRYGRPKRIGDERTLAKYFRENLKKILAEKRDSGSPTRMI